MLFRKKFSGKVFFGTGCSDLLQSNICQKLGTTPGKIKIKRQNDGEIYVKYEENVRDFDVYLVQPTHMPYENFFELLIMADAALRSCAGSITLVIPYLLHARQDRKDEPRVSLTAKLVAKQISNSGANKLLLLDLHTPAIQGFFDENKVKVDELYGSIEFIKFIKERQLIRKTDDLIFASTDVGGIKRARFFAEKFDAGLAFIDKKRSQHGQSDALSVTIEIGDTIKSKTIIFVDDLIDTGGSLIKSSQLMKEQGCLEIFAISTHPVLSKEATINLQNSPFTKIFVTDSVPRDLKSYNKFEIISLGKLFGEAIRISNSKHQSLSKLFS